MNAIEELKKEWKEHIDSSISNVALEKMSYKTVRFIKEVNLIYAVGMWDSIIEFEGKKNHICLNSNPYDDDKVVVYPNATAELIEERLKNGTDYWSVYDKKILIEDFFKLPFNDECEKKMFISLFSNFNYYKHHKKLLNERSEKNYKDFCHKYNNTSITIERLKEVIDGNEVDKIVLVFEDGTKKILGDTLDIYKV